MLLILESGPYSVASSCSDSHRLWLPDSGLWPSKSVLGFPPPSACPNSYSVLSLPIPLPTTWVPLLKPLHSQSHISKISVLEPPLLPTSALQICTCLYFIPGIWGTWGSLTPLGGSQSRRDFPSHTSTYTALSGITGWGERLRFLNSLPPPICTPSFLWWCYSWSPTRKGLPLSAQFTPFLEGTSYSVLSEDCLSRLVLWEEKGLTHPSLRGWLGPSIKLELWWAQGQEGTDQPPWLWNPLISIKTMPW